MWIGGQGRVAHEASTRDMLACVQAHVATCQILSNPVQWPSFFPAPPVKSVKFRTPLGPLLSTIPPCTRARGDHKFLKVSPRPTRDRDHVPRRSGPTAPRSDPRPTRRPTRSSTAPRPAPARASRRRRSRRRRGRSPPLAPASRRPRLTCRRRRRSDTRPRPFVARGSNPGRSRSL